ncbi:mRNA splicing protein [Maudiozyma humilis]|uniref:RNA helicase n=1 Tax=Maudiozyma humilis TaxID=51915 RepID=A0AAV5RXX9_MAUHU|nr:mRNA splicing protein [Kazachstania humilis]
MARPVSVNELLGKCKSGAVGKGKTGPKGKARFLSKEERAALASETVAVRETAPGPAPTPTATNTDANTPAQSRPRDKFSFGWQDAEDTLAGHTPITSLSARQLLRGKDRDTAAPDATHTGRHWAQKPLGEMTARDWRILSEDFQLTLSGTDPAHPLRTWAETEGGTLPRGLVAALTGPLGLRAPTPIQRAMVPNAAAGRSVLGVAATGSGKTLAFLLPLLARLGAGAEEGSPGESPRPRALKVLEGPRALVLAPTRELALQIAAEAQRVLAACSPEGRESDNPLSVVAVVGGRAMEETAREFAAGCDVLVATPGRLIDCLENRMVPVGSVDCVVLDEADKMVDLGFEEQLEVVLARLRAARGEGRVAPLQTLMFTATMTPTIEAMARNYLRDPVTVRVGAAEDAAPRIRQVVAYVPGDSEKFAKVLQFLRRAVPPVILFVNHKRVADELAQRFHAETRYRVVTLHGSKNQEQRERALQLLREGRAQVMVATNVAARGIDVPDVSLVVNYEMPRAFEDYVHRIGRTGRAGKQGTALTLLGDYEELETVRKLEKYTRTEDPLGSNEFDPQAKKKYGIGGSQFANIIH